MNNKPRGRDSGYTSDAVNAGDETLRDGGERRARGRGRERKFVSQWTRVSVSTKRNGGEIVNDSNPRSIYTVFRQLEFPIAFEGCF